MSDLEKLRDELRKELEGMEAERALKPFADLAICRRESPCAYLQVLMVTRLKWIMTERHRALVVPETHRAGMAVMRSDAELQRAFDQAFECGRNCREK